VNLLDAVSYHQLVLASEGRTEATQRQYLYFEKVFLRYLEREEIKPTLDALNPANVRGALEWYQHQPAIAQRTRGGEVGGMVLVDTMHLFARFLEREEILPDDPLRKMRRVKIAKRLREPFSKVEVVALWGATRSAPTALRDEALLLLLLDTGMRIGEACTITLDKLKLAERQIIVGADGKGRRERIVPVGQIDKRGGGRTLSAIRRYLGYRPDNARGRNRLFLGRDGYPLEAHGGSAVIARLGKIAGIEDAGPHRLRHSFATQYLVTYPGDEIGLRRVIGHISSQILADYVHIAQSIIADRTGRASLAEQWLGGPAEGVAS
jgi:site-specific recombinase XerD